MDRNIEFTRLWTKAQPAVAGFISSLVPDFHQSEDILQDAAVACLRKFDDYDRNRPFTAWAIGIARYQVLSEKRDFARHSMVLMPEAVEAVAAVYEEKGSELALESHVLKDCVKGVKGVSRDILSLRYEQNLKPSEIAERTGKKAGAVRTMLSRLRDTLQDCIDRKVTALGQGGRA